MNLHCADSDGPVILAAVKALETGRPEYILIWTPENAEHTVRNLVEKTCCGLHTRFDSYDPTTAWFFRTISHLHALHCGSHNLNLDQKNPEERQIILMVEHACGSGSFEDLCTGIRDLSVGEIREQFRDVCRARKYPAGDIPAGRAYVNAITGFIARLNTLHQGTSGRDGA